MSFACLLPVLISAFVLGFFIIRSGRGTPTLSEPRCANCGYDLRGLRGFVGAPPTRCSECGADLTRPDAIRWGSYTRKPQRIWIGLAVMLLPILMLPLLVPLVRFGAARTASANFPGSPGFTSRSNAQVIASLATSANTPWDWQELQRRLAAGTLSDAEVTQSIDQLIKSLKTQPTNQPLNWAETYLNTADTTGKIPDEQFVRLAHAFYKSCTVSIASKTRADTKLSFTVRGSGPWQLSGCEYVFALRAVSVTGGANLELKSDRSPSSKKSDPDFFSANAPFDIAGSMQINLPAGDYTLVFLVDVAILRAHTAPQIVNGIPGQASNWPKGRAAWTESLSVPMKVFASDRSPIGLTTDPALDPQSTGAIKVNAIRVIRKGAGQRLTVDMSISGKTIPSSFDVILRIAGAEYPLGFQVNWANGSIRSELAKDSDSLDPLLTTADVLLRPNAKHAEGIAGIDRIWGGPIDLLGVPLSRCDLQRE
jgi:hypothetical protein